MRATVLLLLALCTPALGADVPKLPPAPVQIMLFGVHRVEDCQGPTLALQKEMSDLHFPSGWKIVIACNDLAWRSVQQHTDVRNTQTAFTNMSTKTTVLNAAIFGGLRSQYRRTIAHELGHIQCGCGDELQAERIALSMISATRAQTK